MTENIEKNDFSTIEEVKEENQKNKKEKKKKPFFKRPAGIILVVLLVILIGGGVTCYALRNQILKSILGPVNYYIYKESTGIEKLSKEDFSVKGDLTLGQDYKSILVFTGADSSNISIDVQRSVEQDKLKAEFSIFDLMDYELQIDGNYLSSSMNQSEPYVINLKENKTEKKSNKNKNTQTTTAKKKDVEDVGTFELVKLAYSFSNDCISGQIEDGFIKESKKQFKGMDCDVTTFTLNNKLLSKILTSVSDKIEKDKETQKVFAYIYYNKLNGKSDSFDAKSLAKSLREYVANLSDDSDSDIMYSVYYYNGEIVNRVSDNTNIGTFTENGKKYLSIGNKNTLYGELEIKDTADVNEVKIDKSKAQSTDGDLKDSMSGVFEASLALVLRSTLGEEASLSMMENINN